MYGYNSINGEAKHCGKKNKCLIKPQETEAMSSAECVEFDSVREKHGTTEVSECPEEIKAGHGVLDSEDEYTETRCGFRQCRPSFIQRFNNPTALCCCLCAYTLVQGFVINGVNNVNTTSYERRFELTSSSVGWISSVFDFSAAICGVVIGLYGSRRHKGRILTGAFITSSLGSLIMYMPHFLTDNYEWGQENTHLCSPDDPLETCNYTSKGLQSYLGLFILGQLMHGVGGSTLITVGYSFIDDSVPATNAPLYISIIGLFQMLGPMVGFLVGGMLLEVYVDFDSVPKEEWNLTPNDPRWVGAWWVGFFISSILMFLFALPFSLFGTELPSAKHIRKTRVSETHNDSRQMPRISSMGDPVTLRQLPVLTIRLLRNPAFMCVSFAGAFMGLVTVSLAAFLPKYIQNIFGTSMSTAATFAGLIIIPGAAVGQMFGGFVIRHWKLKVKAILKFIIIMVSLAVLSKASFFINCERQSLAGWNTSYNKSSTFKSKALMSTCNKNCHCDIGAYHVVCDKHSIKYFSPCLAGCKLNVDDTSYTDCSCVEPYGNDTSVSAENCSEFTCDTLLYVFLGMILISAFTVSSSTVPALTVILRCAHEEERTFALGLLNFIARIVGTIPGPILYGAIIDSSCDIWGSNCGHRTSCWLYNNTKMGEYLAFMSVGFTSIAVFFFVMAYRLYKPPAVFPKNREEQEEDEGEEESVICQNGEANCVFYESIPDIKPHADESHNTKL